MFRKTTTFVIGAGASKEFSLPTGVELKDQIAQSVRFRFERPWNHLTSGNADLLQILKQKFEHEDVSKFTIGGNKLSDSISLFPSIDEALHFHSADEKIVLLGKLAIAQQILQAERGSYLKNKEHQSHANLEETEGTWLAEFLSIATSGTKQEEAVDIFSNVVLINFNYDRTVEHYLYWALQKRAGVSAEIAKQALDGLRIIRPYGSLGSLEWQERGVPFGGNGDLFALSEMIRTYTEQHADDLVTQIDQVINNSKLVIFLGFGFHGQNLTLFDPKDGSRKENRNVWATVYGIDEKNYQTIGQSLKRVSKINEPRLFAWKANEFFSKFRQSISAEVG